LRNRPDDSRYSFCPPSEALCRMHPSIFFLFCFFVFFFSRLPFSPVAFFPPGESLFFSVESTPENSRRHLVAELLITASLRASNPASLFLRFFFFFFLCLFFFFFFFFILSGLEFRRTYVRTYVRQLQSSHSARSIAQHERTKRGRLHGVAWRTASRRDASRRWNGWDGGGEWEERRKGYRITSTRKRRGAHAGRPSCATL